MMRSNKAKQNLWSLPRVQAIILTLQNAKQDSAQLPSLHPAEVVLGVHHVVRSPFRKISPYSVGCHSPWDGCPSSHPTLAVSAEFSRHPRHPFVLDLPAAELLFSNQLAQENEIDEREIEENQKKKPQKTQQH